MEANMAVCAKLESIVEADELTKIPESARNKISTVLEKYAQLLEDVKNETSELKAISERQQFQFEKEIFDHQERLKECSEESLKCKNQVIKLEESLNSAQKKCQELQNDHDANSLESQSIKKGNELLCQEKRDLADQLEKARNDIGKLNGELKNALEQVAFANEAKYEALASGEEAKLKESNFQHQVKRLEQEKELLAKQINDLNIELSQKNHEIHSLKREKSSGVLDLQLKLENRVDEIHILQKQCTDIKKTVEEKDRRIETLAERIRGINQSMTESEEQYQLELRAQTKLAELYKQSSEEAQQRVQELVRGFKELQKVLNENKQAYIVLENHKIELENNYKTQLEAKTKEANNLKEELKNANDLLPQGRKLTTENLEAMFPSAAAASKVLHSGMTLTQLYTEYIKSREEIQKEKTENIRLTQQLKHIVAEIEENTPVINQRMTEYHKAIETISCLRTQLACSLTDQEHLQVERDDAKRISGQMERENGRLQLQTSDLSRQVQVLLKEIEEARGGFVHSGDGRTGDPEVSSSDQLNANKVISQHLVTFKNIEDLQIKNQQLLCVVRDLSEQQEEQEKKITEQKTAELQTQLEKAMAQLEELQKARIKQAEMVETVIRQRDMYRVLLSNQGFSDALSCSPMSSSSYSKGKGPLSPVDNRLQETKAALKQLQLNFDTYKKEKVESIKMSNEQIEKLRDEASDLRIRNAKLSSQLEYSEERFNLLQTNMDNFKRENTSLREKNQKHTLMITQHQQTINTLRQDIMIGQEKLAKAEVALDNLRSERELLKGIETRLMQEKESLLREQQQQSRMVANLQTVQNNLERIESETQRNLKYQIEKYEKENSMLKSKLENANEEYKTAVKIWDKQSRELQQKLDKEIDRNRKSHEDLVDAYADVHKLKQEIGQVRSKVFTSESQLEKKSMDSQNKFAQPAKCSAEIKNLKEQLDEAQNKIKAFQEQLELAEKSSNNYRSMASEWEVRVKEQDEINKQLKEEMEKALQSSANAKFSLEQNMEEMEKTNRQLIEENMKLVQEKNSKVDDIQKQLSSLKKELEVAQSLRREAEKMSTKAREDCKTQQNMMQEAQNKYERELTLHANDVEQLISVKEEHEQCHKKIEELSQKQRNSQQELSDCRTAWADRERLLLNDHKAMVEKNKDLMKQNEHVLNQLELLGTQMAALQGKNWDEVPSTSDSSTKDTQHLLQVIQFIRKEKEIAATQFDVAASENLRLKMKVEQLDLQISQLKAELSELQENSQVKASSDSQHAEILQKVEMMNLLTDSNKLLRSEKESLSEKTKHLEAKIEELEAKMSPLKAENKEMVSQLEVYTTENAVLRMEIKGWQSRTNQLLEQSHKIGPQEYKNLMKEIEELRRQKGMLADELQKKQNEVVQLNNTIPQLRKECENYVGEKKKLESANEVLRNDSIEQQKTILQVKKIGRKYKTQYDELKISYQDLMAQSSSNDSATREELVQEMQKKTQEMEQEMKTLREELDRQKECASLAKKETEVAQTEAMNKDERAKKLMAQVKQKYSQLSNQKEILTNDNNCKSKEIDALRLQITELKQISEESNLRFETMRSQQDSKIVSLEKELKTSKETIEYLEKKSEELNQKVVHQQKQASKSSTVCGLTDRGSGGTSEPLTANIKPLASPAQASGSGVTLRHTSHSHVAATVAARSTPTASIRPMAIGTVASSATPQTRMAAVLPTTVAPVPVSTEEDLLSIPTQPLPVPQATVQPTPATATVTMVRTTVTAAVTPSGHPLVSEVATTAGMSSVSETSAETVPTQVESVQSHHISGSSMTAPATALVSPRIEGSDGSGDGLPIDTPAPTTSVIVSPPATQTQVVTPTLKRAREFDAQSPSESDGTLTVQKRVRMISEGSQTNQQLSSTSATPSNIAIVSAATVGRKISSDISVSEGESQPMIECQPSTSTAKGTILEETSKSSMEKDAEDEIEQEGLQILEWENQETRKGEEIEGMEDDVLSDSFEDEERMQGVTYPSRSVEDEDMVDETVDNTEEMQPSECIETIGDSSSNDQMDADSNSIQASQDDQCMAPPAHPSSHTVSSRSENIPSNISADTLISHGSANLGQRLSHIPHVPSRQDRPPSIGQQSLTFVIPGQSSVFEDGDDSIVPSTPTLFVPKRTDGFAEAVSSPHVPQNRFVFSSTEGSPSQQGPSQLASQAVGVDDTRMDLSQFDEGGGRTVPSNLLQVSPPGDSVCSEVPDIIISEQPSSPNNSSNVPEVPVVTLKVESDGNSNLKLSQNAEKGEKSTTPDKEASAVTESPVPEVSANKSEEDAKFQKEPQSVITSVASEEKISESPVKSSPSQPGTDTKLKDNPEFGGIGDELQSAQASSGSQAGQRRQIVWTERGKPRGRSSQPMQFSAPDSHPSASVRASRTQRGRRTRFRGSNMYSRSPSSWGGSPRRGRGPRGGHLF